VNSCESRLVAAKKCCRLDTYPLYYDLWNHHGMNNRSEVKTSSNPSPVLPPRGLRIMDAARYAGLSPFYVETLVRSGELPALKLCQHYAILREELDPLLDRKREELENERRVVCHKT
jgi:excisionase family DNA binding protein